MARRKEACHYCGTGEGTREHMFGQWSRTIVARTFTNTGHIVRTVDDTGQVNARRGFFAGKLDPKEIFTRNVCEDCNGKWLSQNQNDVKPILTRLAQLDFRPLTRVEAQVLAMWVTNISMCFESATPELMVTTAAEKRYFRQKSVPPVSWEIYVVPYCGTKFASIGQHRKLDLVDHKTGKTWPGQANLFVFGNLAFYVSAMPNASRIELANLYGVDILWPYNRCTQFSRFHLADDNQLYVLWRLLFGTKDEQAGLTLVS